MTHRYALLTALLMAVPPSIAHAASITVTGGNLYTDTLADFPPGIIPTAGLNTSQTAGSALNISTTTYDFTSTALNFTMQHTRDGMPNDHARSYGYLYFSLQPAAPGGTLGYTISGNYAVTDVGGKSGTVVLDAYLYDSNAAAAPYAFDDDQESSGTHNQTFTLGGVAGDTYNHRSGALAGTLIAGHSYLFYYYLLTNAYPDADNGASATGHLTLAFTDSSLPTADPNATSSTPLPAAALLPLPLLLALPLLRRRDRIPN